MSTPSVIIVLFDGITRTEFFERLDWPYLVKAWSKAVSWERLSPSRIRLRLAGLDGLNSIIVTRKHRGGRIFIGARNCKGEMIQSGVWEYDNDMGIGVCYRRIYKLELAQTLRERLADFCLKTFLKRG